MVEWQGCDTGCAKLSSRPPVNGPTRETNSEPSTGNIMQTMSMINCLAATF